jgi:DNA-binding MurR/RpiR family transcriptional regulator
MFRDRIKKVYDDLSPSFQRLGDFLMDHPYEAAFMTATQLGRTLDVDTATVVRFAQRLDYPGFPELLDEVQAEVKSQLVRYFQPGETAPAHEDVFHAAIRQDLKNLEQFDLTLDVKTIERLITLIESAPHIFVVGDGMTSRPLADLLTNTLRTLGFSATTLATDAATVASEFLNLRKQDLVIAVAVTHYCSDTTSIMELARDRGANTCAFVGAQSWPISRAAELSLVCPNQTPSKGSSTTVFAVAINALFQALFARRSSEVLGRYVTFEHAMNRITELRGSFEFVRPAWASQDDNNVS